MPCMYPMCDYPETACNMGEADGATCAHRLVADRIAVQGRRIAELEAAALAAKVLLEPTRNDHTEEAWQVLDRAYHSAS